MYNYNPPNNNSDVEYAARVFRRPLSTIIGTLDLIREGVFDKLDPRKKQELLENTYAKAKKMNEYINFCICDEKNCMDNTCNIHHSNK